MASLMLERKPTLRRRSAAAPRFCVRHICAFEVFTPKHIRYPFLLVLLLSDFGGCGKTGIGLFAK